MAFLHKAGILHKYINSANILLDRHFQAQITNFRKSRWTDMRSLAVVDSFEEQIRWTAPERLGDRVTKFTEACDIFSFGIVFYEIVTEKFPWQGIQLDLVYKRRKEGQKLSLPPTVPSSISNIYVNCTKLDPKRRFNTNDIINHLEAIRPEDLDDSNHFPVTYEENDRSNLSMDDKVLKKWDDHELLNVTKTARELGLSDLSDFSEAEEEHVPTPQEILEVAERYHYMRDYAKAYQEFKKIEDEFPHALFRMGEYYYYGKGVNTDIKVAVQYFEKAMQKDDGDAMDMMGYMHLKGNEVLPKDRVKAVKLFMQAVEKGIPFGMYHLGVCYFKGIGGLKKDEEESKKLILKAASLGNEEAQNYAHLHKWDLIGGM